MGPGDRRVRLDEGWELARTAPGTCAGPADLDRAVPRWLPAIVPGTVAAVLPDAADVDEWDWWYRVAFDAPPPEHGEEVVLCLGGLATIAEAYLNGTRVLESASMFAAHECEIGALLSAGANELAICCRALAPRLRERRRPRARWRTKVVSEGGLRFFRTMLIGRAPGFAPGPAVAGVWRPVWLERRRGVVLGRPRLRARVTGAEGVVTCSVAVRALPGASLPAELELTVGRGGRAATGTLAVTVASARGAAASAQGAVATGEVRIPEPELWWPHTHGTPALHDVTIASGGAAMHRGRVGFRTLRAAPDLGADGPDLHVNGASVFCRGAVWTPPDMLAPHATRAELARVLGQLVRAGMNMVRIPGVGTYESDAFHDLCDELGVLVWQDFMLANLDYPEGDPGFMEEIEREARTVLERLSHRPSLAVLCGGSEVAQQVAMLGLDPALAHGPLYGELLPRVVREAGVDAPYVPSTPWGGELPFRPGRGVANYYGVGAYRRPLSDARLAGVRFAAECLAFANVPDDEALAAIDAAGGLAVHHPAWKAGVPRDAGAGWDFEDVRDHYLQVLFGVDPGALRSIDPGRYLELSRAASGEVMAEVYGEWRRAGSPCGGALVLWLKDLAPGAGWGLLDHRGEPKVALHHLRRALAPVAVWTTDEGLGGIDVHVANDRGEPLSAQLRVALYRRFEQCVDEAAVEVVIPARAVVRYGVEALLGRFVDVSWAYRFGPPGVDLVVATLERGGAMISQAFRLPVGRPLEQLPPEDLGLTASVQRTGDAAAVVRVVSDRFAYGVRIDAPGWVAADDSFGVEPGHERIVALERVPPGGAADAGAADPGATQAGGAEAGAPPAGSLTALNLAGRVRLAALA